MEHTSSHSSEFDVFFKQKNPHLILVYLIILIHGSRTREGRNAAHPTDE